MWSKFEYIKIVKIEKHKAIFSFEFDPKYHKTYYYTANEKVKSILYIFKQNNHPLTPLNISNLLSMHYNTVSKYLERLIHYRHREDYG